MSVPSWEEWNKNKNLSWMQAPTSEKRVKKPVVKEVVEAPKPAPKKKAAPPKAKPEPAPSEEEIKLIESTKPISAESAKQFAKERHQRVKPVTEYRPVRTFGKNDIWAIDLIDMSNRPAVNNGKEYHYIFMCIDCFTRYAWAIPMVTKEMNTTFDVLLRIFSEAGDKPKKLWADQGSEFYNELWEHYLDKFGIGIYSTHSDYKVSIVERLIRTIKNWMEAYLSEHRSSNWAAAMPVIINQYNNSPHSSLKVPYEDTTNKNRKYEKLTPKQAYEMGEHGQQILAESQYPRETVEYEETPKDAYGNRIKVGDWVRTVTDKGRFGKESRPNWNATPDKVVRISTKKPILFYLEDASGKSIPGSFYSADIQKTRVPHLNRVVDEKGDEYYIDRILKENVGEKKLTTVTLDGVKVKGSAKAATVDVDPDRVAFLKRKPPK